MKTKAFFPGKLKFTNCKTTGVRNLNVAISAHLADDGQVYAKLDASWTSAQLKRLGVADVTLVITLSSSAPANLCQVIMNDATSHGTVDEHVWNLDLPTDYHATGEEGDTQLMIDMIWRHARYNDARGVVGCAICASVEQVLGKVANTWLAARNYVAGMKVLMGEG